MKKQSCVALVCLGFLFLPISESFRFVIEMLSRVKGEVDYATTIYWYGDYDAEAINTSRLKEITDYKLPE